MNSIILKIFLISLSIATFSSCQSFQDTATRPTSSDQNLRIVQQQNRASAAQSQAAIKQHQTNHAAFVQQARQNAQAPSYKR